MNQKPMPPSERTRVRRVADRGRYDRATLHAILDDAYLCHVAFADDRGTHCIPTACWREGEHLYIHGSNGSRMLKLAATGSQVCVCVTHLDGLVLARSAFHHSMNYRSAVIYGSFEVIDGAAKAAAMDTFLERIAPGRSAQARPGDVNELAATTVLRIGLEEAAAKIRSGGPKDDEADLALPVWAGVLPVALQGLPPVPDGVQGSAPEYVARWGDLRCGDLAATA
ncbi:pyridoxamine 5'-phosphate oxidase family protein [Cupriavidus basilensis]|uniref:pyridoxamine 5'-phosphate oxidase family protein n=1 Tax=Cupriavidus TaxID=106589 RepID=UPI0023E81BE7|nr:pyridoxamine 5'-phosphate oxidase family protein [Cupriavidus basilensis]MDF3881302.1 pyridoxamine 5'-phosphate oxidase family protein [Cupriavidus basilensis]